MDGCLVEGAGLPAPVIIPVVFHGKFLAADFKYFLFELFEIICKHSMAN